MNEIMDGGLFKGTKRSNRSSRAKEVVFRNGWQDFQEFLQSCEQRNPFTIAIHILSVNWSRRFILDALLAAEGKQHSKTDHTDLDRAGVTEIHANEIELMDDTENSTGRIIGPYPDGRLLLTGEDKRQVLRSILGDYPIRPFILYVGDSMHDLACMLEADVGIVMGQNASLKAKLQGIKSAVNLVPASEWHIALSVNLALSPNLVQVDNWLEVISIIQALHKHGYI
ncbi:hypothetical protein MYAM1_000829 [Malassezia yamatoensis]|uniref:Uncharacterized protein n=1 Tax=Malassezia yamatoensis TaxID=253288 RepID=A0AAJ5YUY9_9BASI|nr:hypothetical protein MYAM1_000829 [Malassezia yamatoensis]